MHEDIETLVKMAHKPRITAKAFEKMNTYACIVSSIIEQPTEVMGLLVGSADDKTCTATDAYLIADQNVKGGEGVPDGNGVGAGYIWAKKQGKKVVGMWHSHGSHGNFHSPDDDEHLEVLLIKNSYYLKNNLLINGLETPYASSIVINEEGYQRPCPAHKPKKKEHYFCCVCIRDESGEKRIVDDLELEIVESDDDILIDGFALAQEVCNKVKHEGMYLGYLVAVEEHKAPAVSVFGDTFLLFVKQWIADSWDSLKGCLSGKGSGENGNAEEKNVA